MDGDDDEVRRRERSPSVTLPKHVGSPSRMHATAFASAVSPPQQRMKPSVVAHMRAAATTTATKPHIVPPKRPHGVITVPKLTPAQPRRKRKLRTNVSANQWTSVTCAWGPDSNSDDEDNDTNARAINAGVYLIENVATGHCHFGTTWDLRNAAAQSFADLASGAHPHKALVTSFQRDGAEANSSIRYHVIEHIAAPLAAVATKTTNRRQPLNSNNSNAPAIDVAKMEQLLKRRVRHHQRNRIRKRALLLVDRLVVRPLLLLAWPIWLEFVHQQLAHERMAAAVELQRVVRGAKSRSFVQELRHARAIERLQRFVRLCATKCATRRCVWQRQQNIAARCLQRNLRLFTQRCIIYKRRQIVRKWLAARRIQSIVRGANGRRFAIQRRVFIQSERASIAIQSVARGFIARRCVQRQHLGIRLHGAAVVIQTRWRGVLARLRTSRLRDVHRLRNQAAQTIQRRYRRLLSYKHTIAAAESAQLAQQTHDALVVRNVYRKLNANKFGWAAVAIAMEHSMALRLQRCLRQWRQRRRWQQLIALGRHVRAAVAIQRRVRGCQTQQRVFILQKRQQQQRSVLRIQRTWRSHRFRIAFARLLHSSRRERSAICIQSRYRTHRMQQLYATKRLANRRHQAALTLQSRFRMRQAHREKQRRMMLKAEGACRDCNDALATLYSVTFALEVCDTCWQNAIAPSLQTPVTDRIAIALYRRLLPHLQRFQRAYRRFQRRLVNAFGVCGACALRAVRIHCDACGHRGRWCRTCAALLHQRIAQHSHDRTTNRHAPIAIELLLTRTRAAVTIQRHARRFAQRQTLQQLRFGVHDAAARRIQCAYKSRQTRRATRALVAARDARKQAEQRAVVRIQASIRGHNMRQQRRQQRRKHTSALCIQRMERGRQARNRANHLRRCRDAATTIQRVVRGIHGRCKAQQLAQQQQEQRERRAAVSIQRRARGRFARQLLDETRCRIAAQTLQRAWRCSIARAERTKRLTAHQQHQAAIEATAALVRAAERAAMEHKAALCIQTLARRYLVRHELQLRRRVRAQAARKQLFAAALATEHKAATRIQHFVRTQSLQRTTHQRLVVHCCARRFLSRRFLHERRQQRTAAIRIQRAFRAARVRQRLTHAATAIVSDQSVWVELFDDASGYVYYFNTVTLESRWEKPLELGSKATGEEGEAEAEVDSDLEWLEYWDENVGASYYYNLKTGEATWTTPDGVAAEVFYTPESESDSNQLLHNDSGDHTTSNRMFQTMPPPLRKSSRKMPCRSFNDTNNQVADALLLTAPALSLDHRTNVVRGGIAVTSDTSGNQTLDDDDVDDVVVDWTADDDGDGVDTAYDINYKIFLTQLERDTQQQQAQQAQQSEQIEDEDPNAAADATQTQQQQSK